MDELDNVIKDLNAILVNHSNPVPRLRHVLKVLGSKTLLIFAGNVNYQNVMQSFHLLSVNHSLSEGERAL